MLFQGLYFASDYLKCPWGHFFMWTVYFMMSLATCQHCIPYFVTSYLHLLLSYHVIIAFLQSMDDYISKNHVIVSTISTKKSNLTIFALSIYMPLYGNVNCVTNRSQISNRAWPSGGVFAEK